MYGQTGSGKTFTIMGSKFPQMKVNSSYNPENPHKKPPIAPNSFENLEKSPKNRMKSLKTPNKINSASNIANIQIDLNSLMSESEKFEIESEKGAKRIPMEQYPNYFFRTVEANPLKRQTNEVLFNEDENIDGVLTLALKDIFSEIEKVFYQGLNSSKKCFFLLAT